MEKTKGVTSIDTRWTSSALDGRRQHHVEDTDALANPFEAGFGGMVKFDKPIFHGRGPLIRLKSMPARSRLVGFHVVDRQRLVPEGSQIVEEGKPVGRLTSTRLSPTLACSLGLAWLPAEKAQPGQSFVIRDDGQDVPARVVDLPFYDPEGLKLKS